MSIRRSASALFLTAAGCFSLAANCAAASIVRGNVSDIDATGNTSSTISAEYDSGTDGTDRYSVFVVQISANTDDVTDVSYGGVSTTLITKRRSDYAQFNNYNYIYGLANPPTSTNSLVVTGSQAIAANVLATTYSGVNEAQPDTTGYGSIGSQQSSWTSNFTTSFLDEVAIIASGDNNGNMEAGNHATKLSTERPGGAGLQVWEGGAYAQHGANSFTLNGSNGGAMDVLYALLKPVNATTSVEINEIQRVTSGDFSHTTTSASVLTDEYNSGATGTNRYAVFAVQLTGDTDAVTSLSYGSATATLLVKRQSVASGSNNYNYIYGLMDPATGSNTLEVNGSQAIPGSVVAVTYSNVSTSGPDVIEGAGLAESADVWFGSFKSKYPREVAIIASGDQAGSMNAGENTAKLSTNRSTSDNLQVWEASGYSEAGMNSYSLVGANGGGTDVTYVTLHPVGTVAAESGIVRLTTHDFENSNQVTSSVSEDYDSGSGGEDRYSVVTVQLNGTDDVVSSVSYGGVNGKLLNKRRATYSQGTNYNYMFGILNPPTGTHQLVVTGSQPIPGQIAAVTYSGVDATQPQQIGNMSTNSDLSSWGTAFHTHHDGEVAVVMTGDNNGNMAAGMSTEKLSDTRSSGNGLQVWQGGVYDHKGANGFHLVGANGSAFDMSYAILTPAP